MIDAMLDGLMTIVWQASLLLLLVLAVRRPVAEHFGAGWAYALWLVPALLPLLPLPAFSILPDQALSSVTASQVATDAGVAAAPAPTEPGLWLGLMLAFWAGGVIIFCVEQTFSHRAFARSVFNTGRPGDPPLFGGVETVSTEMVDGPLALGLIERRIVLPEDFVSRYSPTERRLALEHELVHHRHFDLWWNVAAMAFLAFHWFNPLAWIAFRAFRCDQELACDAAVARLRPRIERHDYASALVKSASRPGLIAACPLNHADQLKRRLKMMKLHRAGRVRALGGAAAFALVALAGVGLTAPDAAQAERQSVSEAVNAAIEAQGPIITAQEQETINRKCGYADDLGGNISLQSRNGILYCSNGKQVDDPETRALVERVGDRARRHVNAAMSRPEVAAAIRGEADEVAARAIAAVDADTIAERVERAMEAAEARTAAAEILSQKALARTEAARARSEAARARSEAAHARSESARAAAQARATARAGALAADEARSTARYARLATIRALQKAKAGLSSFRAPPAPPSPPPHPRMSAEDRAELEADLAEAREEMRREMADAMREAREEIDREIAEIRRQDLTD